jgi:CRISPR-associated protein Cmr1
MDIDIKTISPMFSGRGDEYFSLTPQSVRGVLRFWFRAVLPRVVNIVDNKGNTKLKGEECDWDYKLLNDIESYIFGSTDFKSPFDVMVKFEPRSVSNNKGKDLTNGNHNEYALYGQENRYYLKNNSIINIKFVIKREIVGLDEVLFNLLDLTSFIGGFGAKSRKGFGSFEIIRNKDFRSLNSVLDILDNLNKAIKELIEGMKDAYNNNNFIFKNKEIKKNFYNINNIDYSSPEFVSSPTYPTLIDKKYAMLESQQSFNSFESLYDYLYKPDPREINLTRHDSLNLNGGMYIKLKKVLRGKYIIENERIKLNNNLEEDSLRKAIYAIDNKKNPSIKFDQSFLGLPINYRIADGHFPGLKKGSYTLSNTDGRKSSQMFIKTFKENNKFKYRITLIKSKITNKKIYKNGKKIDHLKFDKRRGNSIDAKGNEDAAKVMKLLKNLKMVK